MSNEKVFIVALEPLSHKYPLRQPNGYIFERVLVEENEQGWLVTGGGVAEPVLFVRKGYKACKTRKQALMQLELAAKATICKFEDNVLTLKQFLRSVESEVMKS